MKKALRKLTKDTYKSSNVTGDLTEITGDLDECEITDDERKKGIHIEGLIN